MTGADRNLSDSDRPDAEPNAGSLGDRPRDEQRFSREQGLAGDVAAIAEPVLEDMGFRLVRVVVSGRDGGTIQVMFDHPDRDVVAADCQRVSRELDPTLDAYAPKARLSHGLEVSSPGIDRPLVRPSDVDLYVGHEAKVELREMVDGRKRFRGRIEGFEDGELRLEATMDDGSEPVVLGFPAHLIDGAKLILTDELIAFGAARAAAARGDVDDLDDNDDTGDASNGVSDEGDDESDEAPRPRG